MRLGLVFLLAAACFAADAPSRYARLDDLRVHYKSYGEGAQAVVFIHGWSCNLTFWRDQIPEIARKRRVLALDLPGHGLSDKPRITYTQDLFARAVDAVMRDAGVSKAVVVGHSMGTPVARQFIRIYPAKALALVAVDGFVTMAPDAGKRADAYRKFAERYRGPDYRERAAEAIDEMSTAATPADLRDRIRSEMLRTPQYVMLGAMQSLAEPSVWKTDKLDIPALVIFAVRGQAPAGREAYIRTLAPDLEYQEWEGAGHFLMMEQPERFNRALEGFLDRHRL